MLAGCVPLIIQPGVRQPLEDVLPYDSFALRVGADAVPRLHTLLASVSDADHARMRERAKHYGRAFDWVSSGGLAYAFTRYSLCLRAGRESCEALRPAILDEPGGSAQAVPPPPHRSFGDYNIGAVDATLKRVPGR